jgi:hypothetical protein
MGVVFTIHNHYTQLAHIIKYFKISCQVAAFKTRYYTMCTYNLFFIFLFGYLMMLSVSRLYSNDDCIINLSMLASILYTNIHILTCHRPRCTSPTCEAVHTKCSLAKSFICITIPLLFTLRQNSELSVNIYIYFDL